MRAVKVRQDVVQQVRALDQAGFERIPLGGRNEERNRIQIPRAVHAERIAVDIVGDAVFANSLPGDLPAAGKFFGAERGHGTDESIPMRAQNAWGGGHLVVDAGGLAITGAQEGRIERVWGNTHRENSTVVG